MKDYIQIAAQYQADVLSGAVPACTWVRLACERNRRDLDRQDTSAFPYRFHPDAGAKICQFAELLPHIKGPKAFIVGRDDEDRSLWNTISLEPWQCWILTTLFGWKRQNGARRFRVALVLVPRKNAKALAIDTPIPTPTGFKAMGDLHPGDTVFGSDGQPVKVLAESPVMIGNTCYEVEFSTGERIVADADHLWKTTARVNDPGSTAAYPRRAGAYEQVRTTEDIRRTLTFGRNRDHNHSIKVARAIELQGGDLSIDPYVLGAWLGDGHSAGGRITSADVEVTAAIAAAEGEVFRYASASGGLASTYRIGRSYREGTPSNQTFQGRLRSLGLLNNKHIPTEYLRGSRDQRLALLQGLLDTDGTISKAGQVTFVSILRRLADDVVELMASLGFKPCLNWRDAKIYGRVVGTAYTVQMWPGDVPVFRIGRKLSRQKRKRPTGRSTTRQIVSIVAVPSVPVKCIRVDSQDHQFLVGRSFIPTHNSTIGAVIALYLFAVEGGSGAECYSAATTRDQAKIVAEIAWEMASRSPQFREQFGVRLGSRTTRSLSIPSTAAKFAPLSADAQSLDGLNVLLAIIDELHAHKTRAVWDVLDTATGTQVEPLLMALTTAGVEIGGICHEKLGYLEKILDGVAVDESFFGINYTIDAGDDIRLESVQRKANPNYGVSVQPDDLARKVAESEQVQSAKNNVLTKHFNVWIRTESSWMSATTWQTCTKPGLRFDDLKRFPCWIGVDLAEVRDIAALVAVFQVARDHYAIIGRFYLPEDAIHLSPIAQLSGWEREGYIIKTPGNQADFKRIEADILTWVDALTDLREIDFDRALAAHMQQDLMERIEAKSGRDAAMRTVITVPQSVDYMDPAMKLTERLVLAKTLEHDGNPAMAWMISNVVVERNYKDEIYPRKAGGKDSPNKIDGPVAMFTALSQAMRMAEPAPHFQILRLGGR